MASHHACLATNDYQNVAVAEHEDTHHEGEKRYDSSNIEYVLERN